MADSGKKADKKKSDPISDDDHDKHKLLLALGCLVTAAGSALLGWAAERVHKYNKDNK